MKLETKYEIGQHIWYVCKNNTQDELEVFDTYITGVSVDKNGWDYNADSENFFDIKEEDIILYEDKNKLYETIVKLMKELEEK